MVFKMIFKMGWEGKYAGEGGRDETMHYPLRKVMQLEYLKNGKLLFLALMDTHTYTQTHLYFTANNRLHDFPKGRNKDWQ